jgi:2-polyprenyl-3-methyl-5-hydroxy-6-metoxy-1,4-benzoquinol methylase
MIFEDVLRNPKVSQRSFRQEKGIAETHRTTYDQDYYAQGEGKHRLHQIFQPILDSLYFLRVHATLACIGSRPAGSRRALDIGAGRGEFLYYLRKKGWDVVGTQVSLDAITAAKENYDIDLLLSSLPLAEELGRFDLITYWHVFEHLENPKGHLEQARNLLRDENSVLIIEVPNPQSLGASLCYSSWLGNDPASHINMLCEDDLRHTVGIAGFQVTRVDVFSCKFTWIYLYSALCGWFSHGALDFDLFMSLLKTPLTVLRSRAFQVLFLALISPLVITLSILLSPIGILIKQPEILRLYMRKV